MKTNSLLKKAKFKQQTYSEHQNNKAFESYSKTKKQK